MTPHRYTSAVAQGLIQRTLLGHDPVALVSQWCAHYGEFFGTPYGPTKEDIAAAQQLLVRWTADEIVTSAVRAWKFRHESKHHPKCAFSITVAGFAQHAEEIKKELECGFAS